MLRTTAQRTSDAVLVDVCRGARPAVPDRPGVEQDLLKAARFHRIAPLVHVALRDVRPDLAALLRADRDRAVMHHLRTIVSLSEIAHLLPEIAWVTFKGPTLSESLHPVPGLRPYADLDILVAPSDLREVAHRLLDVGWQVHATHQDLLNGEVTGEIELGRPGGVEVDLHWSLTLAQSLRRRFDLSTEDILRRRVPVTIGDVDAWTFDDPDTLVHLCHHAALSGAVRMLQLLDVDQAARRTGDWDAVVRRARAWGASAQVCLVLGRARRVLGTPVPQELDRDLGMSRAFRMLVAGVDRACPAPTVRQEASWPRLVARAARPTAAGTVRTALQSAASGLVNRMRVTPPAERWVPASGEDLDNYFSAVEAVASS